MAGSLPEGRQSGRLQYGNAINRVVQVFDAGEHFQLALEECAGGSHVLHLMCKHDIDHEAANRCANLLIINIEMHLQHLSNRSRVDFSLR